MSNTELVMINTHYSDSACQVLASGEIVVDRPQSHIRSEDRKAVLLALAQTSSGNQQFVEREVIFDRDMGVSRCVATDGSDDIVYAQRKNRRGITRFVRGRSPEPCRSVVVVLMRSTPDKYVLVTGFVGTKPEPEVWDTNAFARRPDPVDALNRAREFWNTHALIWNPDDIVEGTETTNPPAM